MLPNGTQYHPYYLKAYSRVGSDLLILQIEPRYGDHDRDLYTYEIHITSTALDQTGLLGSYGFRRYIDESTSIFLCEEINGELSVFEGEFEMESEVSFMLPYTSIEYKKLKIDSNM
jgi:hypothetical protein